MSEKKQTRVAVTSRSFSKSEILRRELLQIFPNTTFNDSGLSLADDALVLFLDGCDRAIVALERISDEVLSQLPNLKVISKYGVGLDNIDTDALRRRHVSLGWKAGVNRRSVAELALSFMISLLHNVPRASTLVKSGHWQQTTGRQLTGKTVGIVGCGNVGKDLVSLLQPFDVTILAHDVINYEHFYTVHGVVPVDLETLLSRSDIVTLHLPRDTSTENILNAACVSLIKPGAVLINTARGGLVDEEAVADALSSGRLAGAAFDVFAQEPPNKNRLLSLPNVIVTPHIGGSAEEAILAMGRSAIQGLEENHIP